MACSNCGFKITHPRPALNEIGAYYKSDKYVSHSNKSFGLMSMLYKQVRKIALNGKYKLLKEKINGKSILDIGCGTGAFIAFMQDKGFDVTGVEPDEDARRNAEQLFRVKPKEESFLQYAEAESFDLITMWHVLEHVYDLNERISTIHRILKNDGLLCVAVPNPECYDAELYKEFWAAWDVPRHLWHFRPKDIKSLFSNYSFEMFEMHPMKFDAYYVSMLSEKYRGSSHSFLSGLFQGWLSNRKAKKDTFSSQIYLLRKTGSFQAQI